MQMNSVLETPLLQDTADQLRHELSAVIEAIDEMQTRIAPMLTARYQAALGRLELQLLELQIAVRSARRRIEFLQSRINHGEPVTAACLSEIGDRIATELAEWRLQVASQAQALAEAQDFLARVTFADSNEVTRVKTAYRRLARYLHPDASPENSDLFQRYWPVVQEAYQRIDAALIEALQHLVEHAVEERSDKLPVVDRASELDRLRTLIATHAERLAHLKTMPPHCYADLLTNDAWVADRQAVLEEAIASQSEQLTLLVIRQSELITQPGIGPHGAGGCH
jgi:hypothetical protein